MIVPEKEKTEIISHQMWKFLKKESYWKEIASNMMVPEKDKSEKNTTNVKVPDKETFWKEIASNIMVPEKYKSEQEFIASNVKVPERENFWKEITSYMIVLGQGKKLYKKKQLLQ